ncbi:MAG: electron transport complex subunit E, partial [Candidatus Krumholzibacteria bacterium]|nr:electron transport complex subunit E [Candidatus Krumholzibacteria bacterium]
MTSERVAGKADKNVEVLIKGFWRDNPVFVMLLGMCPVLAVTNSVINALAMGMATTFVLFMSSTIVSLIRRLIPKQVRIASFILIIATFVTVVEYLIQAISLEIHKSLGAFISLIVVNCVILGRAEAFASKNPVGKSMLDALGVGVGFTFACLCLGFVRELLGAGTIAGVSVFGSSFEGWSIMILPGGAFFVLGAWLLLFNWLRER